MKNDKMATIPLPRFLIIELADMCKGKDTYADVITRLLASHKKLQDMEVAGAVATGGAAAG